MRFVMGLTIAGAALLVFGVVLVFIRFALRLTSPHDGPGFVQMGGVIAICGLACGVALLAVLAVDLADRAGRVGPGRTGGGGAGADLGGVPPAEWLRPLPPPGTGPAGRPREPAEAGYGYPGSGYADYGWRSEAGGGWSPGPAYVWTPRARDDWESGDDGWSPADQDDWAPDDQDGWATDGQDGWATDGQDGWAADGQDGWAADGQDGWAAAGHADWSDGGQQWAFAGQDGWATDGQDGWGDVGQQAYLTGREPGHQTAPATAGEPEQDGAVTKKPPEAGDARAADDTSPLPVIRDTGPPGPARDAPAPAPFSVWEPAPKKQNPERDHRSGHDASPGDAGPAATAEPLSADTLEKLEQIKDLYLTAEAIGEDALVRDFDQLSKMQRSLIREFFEKAGLGSTGMPGMLAGSPADPGAVSPLHPRAPASPRPAAPPPPR
jgi:hypothetical protein